MKLPDILNLLRQYAIFAASLIFFCCLTNVTPSSSTEQVSTLTDKRPGSNSSLSTDTAKNNRPKHYNKNALHRLDFRIEGKSCPVCLRGIQRRIEDVSGVVEAAVMLKKPYGASVIYDSKQVSQKIIMDTATFKEPLVKTVDSKDAPIDKIPLVLIPPHPQTQ